MGLWLMQRKKKTEIEYMNFVAWIFLIKQNIYVYFSFLNIWNILLLTKPETDKPMILNTECGIEWD